MTIGDFIAKMAFWSGLSQKQLAFAYSEGRRAVKDTPDYLASRLALQGYKGALTKERIVYYGGARTGVNTEVLKVEGI